LFEDCLARKNCVVYNALIDHTVEYLWRLFERSFHSKANFSDAIGLQTESKVPETSRAAERMILAGSTQSPPRTLR